MEWKNASLVHMEATAVLRPQLDCVWQKWPYVVMILESNTVFEIYMWFIPLSATTESPQCPDQSIQ